MENKSFEQLIIDLESIVRSLEDKSISLDEAVKKYSEGVDLSKQCYDILNKNEELVVKKMTDGGLVDFSKE